MLNNFIRDWPWVQSGFLTLHSFVRNYILHIPSPFLNIAFIGYDHEDALVHHRQ